MLNYPICIEQKYLFRQLIYTTSPSNSHKLQLHVQLIALLNLGAAVTAYGFSVHVFFLRTWY